MTEFTGKKVAVIGGSSGIGRAIARQFHSQGADVEITGTRGSSSEYSEDGIDPLEGLSYSQLDVSDRSACLQWCDAQDWLDVLILCHGVVIYKRMEFDPEVFAHVLDVNLTSLMTIAGGVLEKLKAAQGSVIVVSSTAAFHATVGNPAYSASKAGAVGLTRTLGKAWAPDGVRVNGIAPGFVETKMTAVTMDDEKRRQQVLSSIPVGFVAKPEDLAEIALFLASPAARYVVGQTLVADGGMLL